MGVGPIPSVHRRLERRLGFGVEVDTRVHELFGVDHGVVVAQGDAVDAVGLGDQRLVQRASDALAQAAQHLAVFHGADHGFRIEHEDEGVEAAVDRVHGGVLRKKG